MKCPKCGYVSFDFLDICKKCGHDLVEIKARYNIFAFRPAFIYASEEEEAEAISAPRGVAGIEAAGEEMLAQETYEEATAEEAGVESMADQTMEVERTSAVPEEEMGIVESEEEPPTFEVEGLESAQTTSFDEVAQEEEGTELIAEQEAEAAADEYTVSEEEEAVDLRPSEEVAIEQPEPGQPWPRESLGEGGESQIQEQSEPEFGDLEMPEQDIFSLEEEVEEEVSPGPTSAEEVEKRVDFQSTQKLEPAEVMGEVEEGVADREDREEEEEAGFDFMDELSVGETERTDEGMEELLELTEEAQEEERAEESEEKPMSIDELLDLNIGEDFGEEEPEKSGESTRELAEEDFQNIELEQEFPKSEKDE